MQRDRFQKRIVLRNTLVGESLETFPPPPPLIFSDWHILYNASLRKCNSRFDEREDFN